MSTLSGRKILPANVTLLNHPVVEVAITRLRICKGGKSYTDLMTLVGRFLAIEATRDLPTKEWIVVSRMRLQANGRELDGRVGLVSITRGGNDLIEAFRGLLPESPVYHVAARRKSKAGPNGEKIVYAELLDSKLPKTLPSGMKTMIVLDPMFASGSSAELVLNLVQTLGPSRIIFVCALAAPEGMDMIAERFPDVRVIMAQLDERLNDDSYIEPGWGDGSDISNCTEHD